MAAICYHGSASELSIREAVPLDDPVEARAGDPEDLSGLPLYSTGPVQDSLHVGGLGGGQRVFLGLWASVRRYR